MSSLLHLNASLNLNIKIFVLSRNPSKFKNKFPEVRNYKELFFIKGNIVNFTTNENDFTHIIHGATEATIEAHQNISNLSDVVINGTKNILNFANKKKLIIYFIFHQVQYTENSLQNLQKLSKVLDFT